ncbi:GumC family protein [Salinarimonas ramus]|uniref:Uncharacterized protein n=1 Tax=Salinarimonas ramus TaxID=690164 RepID=A0A917Q7V4_9HYPH|nr:exopolysaccharide transport family protein [Salinarimonas ramus]GGK34089.1 hypothetical protein GCM10011322_20980 [Salinarimonas ramus]
MKPFRDAAEFLDDPFPAAAPRLPAGWLDLRVYLALVRRRAPVVVATTLVGVALGFGAYLLSPERYAASAILLVDPRQQNVLSSESVLSGFGQDAAAVESQVELITSTAVLGRVVAEEGLASDPDFVSAGLRGRVMQALGLSAPEASSPERDAQIALSALARSLWVQRRGLTYILEVGVTTGDPQKSARLANAVAETYLGELVGARVDATRTANDFLADRIDDLRARLEISEQAVADFRSSNEILDVGQGDTLLDRRVAQLGADLAAARARVIEAQARRDQLALVGERLGDLGSLGEALQSPVVAELRVEYAELERNAAELELVYGPDHPALRQAQARADRAEALIRSEIGRISAGVENELETALRREASLQRDFEDLQGRYRDIGSASVRLRELEREAEANRAVYEQALLRLRETGEQEDLRIADARLVSPALPPLRKSAPKGSVMLAAGGVVGLFAGLAFALFAEATRRGFRTPDEAEAALGLAALGALPRSGGARGGRNRRRGAEAASDEITRAALRGIRARLREAGATRVVVTSVSPGEGKSTLALALARAFAVKGRRTLAIDADGEGAGLGTALGIAGENGFADLMRGRATLGEVLVRGRDGEPAAIPAGSPEALATLADLMEDADLGGFVERLATGWDQVVFDAPPLCAGGVEAGALARAGVKVLLVVEAERTGADDVEQALRRASIPRSAIVGFVLAKAAPETVPAYAGSARRARAA